jgi:hypothetical protein
MHPFMKLAAGALLAVVTGAVTAALAATDPETAPTVDGVRAVENHWGRAFVSGDTAYLEQLLADEYVSVNQSGRVRPKAEIIELSRKIASGPNPPKASESTAKIVVHGTAAISTAQQETDASVDVFFYAGGRWHAWYSQHSPVKPPDPDKK